MSGAWPKLAALWRMARPLMLLSIFLVYATGALAALAHGCAFSLPAFAWGWAALLAASLSIHYINEYADYETDRLTQRTQFSGGSGALPAGLVPRAFALHAARAAAALSGGLALIGWLSGAIAPVALAVLALGLFGGWMYSAPPLKLAWRGWGELDNALLGGLLLPLAGYAAQAGAISLGAAAAFIPFTLLVFVNLLATTWADRTADAAAGKFTLATTVKPRRLRLLYLAALIGACVALAVQIPALPTSVTSFVTPALPLMAWGWLSYTRRDAPNPSVYLMVAFLAGQLIGWGVAALGSA